MQGHTAAIIWLLEHGADANSLNQGQSTALHSAASHGQAAAVELLMYMGLASASFKDTNGETPKDVALSAGHQGIAKQIALADHVSECFHNRFYFLFMLL